ncbi:squalene--hopene cyclase [Streptomyces clavuligerus]|uniref:Squalene-hopene cyclase n=1 Tax=Streptomyces clavuligerus TaxID=1901 RepID=E2PZ48_STRCL|nr:squalene--hopene cyclase [Streptomyces clavuligerus]ANW17224.1 squalene-hopene cyclase [Streptomyces clavuligerus]AXU11764.1 squalene--hopene cyclase [Streptomyces clavuligerus]EFG10309.1 squalene-hopene cyclase [Streptomyces clavuligerus]MBY6301602.1 squalene--hopene cyclase [Streptomyces clavuligerus]QCS04544.1 squalene--hopene cyclase [Streptomyces clavuligerus]
MTATTDSDGGPLRPAATGTAADTAGRRPPVPGRPGAPGTPGLTETARWATTRSVEHLLGRQHSQGWWKGDLQTNVTMDAEDLLLRQFLGILDARTAEAAARFIRGEQRSDGAWATFHGGPGDLSTTVEAYVALRLAGDLPGDPHLAGASAWVRHHGGIAGTRVFTRIWLALFGWWPWDELPELPPELIFLPSWFPLNIYDFGCWARQTIVPLTVVSAMRPVRAAPFALDELHTDPANPRPPRPLAPATTWDGLFQRADRTLRRHRRLVPRRLRRAALAAAARWIVERQESDGCWGGIQPPAVYSLIALNLLGHDLDHPVLRSGIASLDRFAVWRPDGSRMVEACQSPVWDTALATVALADAGLPADHPALVRAAEWLLGEEVVRTGDWAVRRPGLAPGGWAFEFHNDTYPDIDDTAEVILALRRVSHPDPARVDAAVARAGRWTLGMQSAEGGWAAFDADNTSPFPDLLPFCDFGEVTDPPSADVTAHVVEMLAYEGRAHHPRARRGIDWLLERQESCGAWFGRWGTNYLYGTGAVVPALIAAGIPAAHPAVRRAVHWLVSVQNDDGGWGEDQRSYQEEGWAGRGASTASQTAWALLALLAAGERDGGAAERGVAYLAGTQRGDGSWDEPHYTGTGFPWDFSINYHLYRQVFPLTALGRYLHGEGAAAVAAPLRQGG